jgi:hypothetical protein
MIIDFWKRLTSKPKIAILIVGEYRTFANCRKSMQFLDQTNIDADIYVSTWDITNTLNPEIRTLVPKNPVYIPVTKDQIECDIGISITCAIHTRQEISAIPPIIRGWLLGFDLLKKSSVSYDYVLVLRPDLFFENTKSSNSILKPRQFKKYKNSIGIRYSEATDMADDLFFSSYENVNKFFSKLMEYWELNGVTRKNSWHTMLYYFITEELRLTAITPPFTAEYVIARYPITPTTTFDQAWEQWWKWFRENE